ncbi:MAG: glutamine--fructose-6-phosphate transaminase (isomerizing) [Deltaproteobacteria bacterium]|nr:glutamine--fructose-6-phosphate transaminase (isomerizing) [Deltaproteobacteria bacterium]
MCGIVGYIGQRQAVEVLVDGLRRLEYRGYDSSGVAVVDGGEVRICRALGKLGNLEAALARTPVPGNCGLGHIRWATHGKPSETNAHPHKAGRIVVVHNGIIENYLALKKSLAAEGRRFASETDTEVISHLIDRYRGRGLALEKAVAAAAKRLEGSFAIGVLCEDQPGTLVAARRASPLVVGLGEREQFFASDIPALLRYTSRVVFLQDDELAVLTRDQVRLQDLSGRRVTRPPKAVHWTLAMAERGGYKHFMQKEICEQPRALIDTTRGRLRLEAGAVALPELDPIRAKLEHVSRITIAACGTSYHAALVGKYLLEEHARIPVEVDLASEFRYRDPLVGPETLLLVISQSGETADTLAALREGKAKGALTAAICNVVDSSIAREAQAALYTYAGPEISVASTKAFSTQIATLHLVTLYLARLRGTLPRDRARQMVEAMVRLPQQIEQVLRREGEIERIAKQYRDACGFLYLGRGPHYPIALEGALKLKEIAYIHAEGYAAAEMKHGPIALITEQMPVVMLIPKGRLYEKTLSNLEEVRSRDGQVIALATRGDRTVPARAQHVFFLPPTTPELTTILEAVPLQLLAYHIAVLRGTDVDQPRNLAKSVTVE